LGVVPFLRHVQFGQHGQRQNQNSQVEEDLSAASNEAEQMYVGAARSGRRAPPAVPKEADRHALEDHGKCVFKSEVSNESHQNPDSQVRLLVDHDAEVECEDRELKQAFGDHAHEVRGIQPLQASGDIVGWNAHVSLLNPKRAATMTGTFIPRDKI
jgi:hypothetical protein